MNNAAITYISKLWTILPTARFIVLTNACYTTGYPPPLNDAIVKYNKV